MKRKVFVFFFLLFSLMLAGCGNEENDSGYHIGYLNKEKTGIVKVPYDPVSTDAGELVAEFLLMLSSEPDNVELRKPIPSGVYVTNYSLEGVLLTIWFNEDYNGMSEVEEVLCRAAVVRTITQIEGVERVAFFTGDTPLTDHQGALVGTMYADSFVENPGEQINSIHNTTLTLYFSNEAGNGLVTESRNVHYSSNISNEKLIMEQLLEGPERSGMKSAIPSGTKLVSIAVVEGVCYVSLDETFKNQDYDVNEAIVIYSIVDSLSELPSIGRVQISVNGNTGGVYRDNFRLSDMYERNLDYMAVPEADGELEPTVGTEGMEAD